MREGGRCAGRGRKRGRMGGKGGEAEMMVAVHLSATTRARRHPLSHPRPPPATRARRHADAPEGNGSLRVAETRRGGSPGRLLAIAIGRRGSRRRRARARTARRPRKTAPVPFRATERDGKRREAIPAAALAAAGDTARVGRGGRRPRHISRPRIARRQPALGPRAARKLGCWKTAGQRIDGPRATSRPVPKKGRPKPAAGVIATARTRTVENRRLAPFIYC